MYFWISYSPAHALDSVQKYPHPVHRTLSRFLFLLGQIRPVQRRLYNDKAMAWKSKELYFDSRQG
jgi:hypothetical protein